MFYSQFSPVTTIPQILHTHLYLQSRSSKTFQQNRWSSGNRRASKKKSTSRDCLALKMKVPSKGRGLLAQRHGVITRKTCIFKGTFTVLLSGFSLRLKPQDRHVCRLYNDALSQTFLCALAKITSPVTNRLSHAKAFKH